MLSQTLRGTCRAGEGHGVLAIQMVEQVAGTTTNELYRAFRQDPRFNDTPEYELGEIRRRGGGLDDCRHPSQQGGRELLEHTPYRKVERVDVHRRSLERRAD